MTSFLFICGIVMLVVTVPLALLDIIFFGTTISLRSAAISALFLLAAIAAKVMSTG